MRCSACDTDNPSAARFCNGCGAALEASCVQCGHGNPPASRFCNGCGGTLADATRADRRDAESPSTAPSSYTPRHLAEKILASRGALEGERKQVTVLFADIKGSTELIEGLDSEAAQRLLDGAVKVMMDAVHRYEGTISRAMGDGIMALFGAPIAHEDHAVRACYAALAMQDATRRYAEEARRAHGLEVEIRAGLNSGEVIVRLISDDLHMDYTALGPTVHLASRMEQLARASTTRLTAATLALVEGFVQVRSLGPIPIKGLAEPVDAFELIGAGVIRTRLQASAARGLTPFVGRQAEVEALHAALERARDGRGQVAALVGEPGVGKSRLVWEVTHSHRAEGWAILESGSVSYGKATSYLPIVDLLKSYCRIDAQDDARTIREKVTGKLLTLDRTLEPILPALLALLDVPMADPAGEAGLRGSPWERLDPAQRRRQTLDAVKRLLLRESQEQPLLLIFEDLHWIDAETQAVLDSLVESLPTARILLLVNYRPEYRHEWGNRGYYTQLRIDPLAPESAEELLASLLGEQPSVRSLGPLLIGRTEGNPFFLEECVRMLVERGVLAGERGAYRVVQGLASIQVPPTVQAILAARIDRLPAEEKRLLQTAAVVGKDVPAAILHAVADGSEAAIQHGLVGLQAAEFLYEASLFPELEYTFKHALTHEVAYASLLQERRRELHGRIVDAIERLYPGRLDEHVERLADHAERGQIWEKAVAYCHQAGLRALDRWANREAAAWVERALAALAHVPETPGTLSLALDLRLDARRALQPLLEVRRIFDHLRVAQALAECLEDQRRRVQVTAFQANCHQLLRETDRAIEAGRRAVAAAEGLDDLGARVVANFHLGTVYSSLGDYRQSLGFHLQVVRWLEGDLARERFGMAAYPSVMAAAYAGRGLGLVGRFDEAFPLLEQATRIAEAVDQPESSAEAMVNAGIVYIARGDPERGIAVLERAAEIAETWDLRRMLLGAGLNLGVAYALAGRADEALVVVERTASRISSWGITWRGAERLLAEGYLRSGRTHQAEQLLWPALESARAIRQHSLAAECLWLLGEVEAGRDLSDVERAQTHFYEALSLAEEEGMRPLQAHCHLGLGKLYRRVGRLDEARAELSTAIGMLRDMEMTPLLLEAEAELAPATALL